MKTGKIWYLLFYFDAFKCKNSFDFSCLLTSEGDMKYEKHSFNVLNRNRKSIWNMCDTGTIIWFDIPYFLTQYDKINKKDLFLITDQLKFGTNLSRQWDPVVILADNSFSDLNSSYRFAYQKYWGCTVHWKA